MGEDKGEKKIRVKKSKKNVNKSKRWFEWDSCPSCKEICKIKFSIMLRHNKLSQNFHSS